MVQSPIFQSPTGSALQMGSRTMTLTSAGQVQALDALFASPKFVGCYQQYVQALVAGAAPGAVAQVQSVTLPQPSSVQSYGVVTTYVIPGAGTEVVGEAYMLGGRLVSVLQPTTNGPAVPGDVFTQAYDAMSGRMSAAAGR